MPPTARAAPNPQLFLDGTPSPELGRDLASLCVHAVDGKAFAEVELVGHSCAALGPGIYETELKIRLSADEDECFSGQITAIEGRIPPDASPQTVLFAQGKCPDGSAQPTVPLGFGEELESAAVRREAGSATARGVSSALALRCNSCVEIFTHNSTLDGQFQIVEIWYRFNLATGAKVEFVAEA